MKEVLAKQKMQRKSLVYNEVLACNRGDIGMYVRT